VHRRLVVSSLALATLLVGCGGEDPQQLLDGASEALEAAGTSRFEMSVQAAGEEAPLAAEGAQDLGTGALRMAIDLGDEATSTETLLLGTDVYVRSPLFELFTGDPETWVRVDLTETAAEQGLDADALLGSNTGPAALLAQLEGATDEVEELGDEEVRGVATTKLRVSVDTQAALERSDPSIREQLRTYADQVELPERYPMELWIDDDGLVRRIRTVVDVATVEGGGGDDGPGATQETVLELYDFGVSVDLDAPREDRTVELADLVAELERLERADAGG
jgi:hypothetical protein